MVEFLKTILSGWLLNVLNNVYKIIAKIFYDVIPFYSKNVVRFFTYKCLYTIITSL